MCVILAPGRQMKIRSSMVTLATKGIQGQSGPYKTMSAQLQILYWGLGKLVSYIGIFTVQDTSQCKILVRVFDSLGSLTALVEQ